MSKTKYLSYIKLNFLVYLTYAKQMTYCNKGLPPIFHRIIRSFQILDSFGRKGDRMSKID